MENKGRKFWVLQEILGLTILYNIACYLEPKLMGLMPLVMTVAGVAATYMGANAIAKKATK